MNEFTRYRAASLSPNRKMNEKLQRQETRRLKASCASIGPSPVRKLMQLDPAHVDVNAMGRYGFARGEASAGKSKNRTGRPPGVASFRERLVFYLGPAIEKIDGCLDSLESRVLGKSTVCVDFDHAAAPVALDEECARHMDYTIRTSQILDKNSP